jgi:hypothetical protein
MRTIGPAAAIALLAAAITLADPYGPPYAVTDMAPFCATCHASTSISQLPDIPSEAASRQMSEEKHVRQIRTAAAYKELTAAERESLIEAVHWIDEQAAVSLEAPRIAKKNNRIEVMVVTKGGAGPFVGVSLVDSGIRFQARPLPSSGFKVLGPPLVIGPDRKPQTDWIERRLRGGDLGLSTVMISGIAGNAMAKHVDETRTTWSLRTPPEPGLYRLAAAFYYGTEKAHPLGTVMRAGRPEPRGGADGASGRIMFSQVVTISVQ